MPPPLSGALWPLQGGGVADWHEDNGVDAVVNMQVLILSWLHSGFISKAPLHGRLGYRMSQSQLAVVSSLRKRVLVWQEHSQVTPDHLGRAATKYISVTAALSGIQTLASKIRKEIDPYAPHTSSDPSTVLAPGFRSRDYMQLGSWGLRPCGLMQLQRTWSLAG